MMPGVKHVIYGCSPARLTPGVSLYQGLILEENIIAVITIWKSKLKTILYVLVGYSY